MLPNSKLKNGNFKSEKSKSESSEVEESYKISSREVKVGLEESSISVCPKSEKPMTMMTSSNPLMTGDGSLVSLSQPLQSDLVCPVCSSRKFKDETSLSYHVEECLNRQTIAELLRTDNSALPGPGLPPSKKRKSSQSEMKTLKKSRSGFTKTIDSYFNLKS